MKTQNIHNLVEQDVKEISDYLMSDENIKSVSGRFGNIVFYTYRKTKKVYIRTYRYPSLTKQNNYNGKKVQIASVLWKQINNTFKADLNDYAKIFYSEFRRNKSIHVTGYNIFCKCILKIEQNLNDLNELREIAGNTINQWIQNSYLDQISAKIEFTALLMDEK